MPIKLPKGFQRRKSSGNVLDDVQKPQHNNGEPPSSFKVLARPQSTGRPLDGTSPPRSTGSGPRPPRKSSFDDDGEDLFSLSQNNAVNRGSGATANSLSTTAQYDSGASSTRLSSSSTNPSSVDAGSARNVKAAAQRPYDDIPVPPPHGTRAGFLKTAGRTFSFGMNKNNNNNNREGNDLPPIPTEKSRRTTITNSGDRAMTISSTTTTTAPRLDDSSLALKDADDDFGNMFADINPRASYRENLTNMHPTPPKSAARAAPPQSIYANSGANNMESSQYFRTSQHSQNSRDGLIASPSPSSRTVIQPASQPSALRHVKAGSVHSDVSQGANWFDDAPLRRSPVPAPSQPQHSPTSSRAPPSSFPTAAINRPRAQSNTASTIRSYSSGATSFDMPRNDPAFLANAQLADRYQERQASPVASQPSNKVMTPAEFERYKQQKEDTRRYNKVFGTADSDDGSGDDYDDEDDDEQEREKENNAVKQRKKQEAHLAVYRQQMMKVTGDKAITPERRPMSGYQTGNSSQLDLSPADRRMSSFTTLGGKEPASGVGKPLVDDEGEDEDVPLGILAAHGFPNKNRPPTRLAVSSSNPNLRTLAQTQGSTSVVGGEGGRGPLPAFARNLPVDPYYGASLIQQPERVPLQMHAAVSQTHLGAQPQPSGASTAHPLHPAGLVGVIAGEERARAMRRGSPNAQNTGYDMPMGSPQPMRTMSQYMPGYPPQQPMLNSSEQAQLQMSQSMTQMMQVQMQWMQQMASMMGQNPNMQMPPMPVMGMPGMPPQQPQMQQHGNPAMLSQNNGVPIRPQSVPIQNLNGGGNQRTMSTLAPSMAGWYQSSPAVPQINAPGSVYAPSIAPSERSNVGLAPRYRPVSTMTLEPENNGWVKRASTFSSTAFRPWTNENSQSKLTVPTVRTVPAAADDDDDEQGWAEMQAKREKKQKNWKMRKGAKDNTLKELYNAPA